MGVVEKRHRIECADYQDTILGMAVENPDYYLSKKQMLARKLTDAPILRYIVPVKKCSLQQDPENSSRLCVLVNDSIIGHVKAGSTAHMRKMMANNQIQDIRVTIDQGPYKMLSDYGDGEYELEEEPDDTFRVMLYIFEYTPDKPEGFDDEPESSPNIPASPVPPKSSHKFSWVLLILAILIFGFLRNPKETATFDAGTTAQLANNIDTILEAAQWDAKIVTGEPGSAATYSRIEIDNYNGLVAYVVAYDANGKTIPEDQFHTAQVAYFSVWYRDPDSAYFATQSVMKALEASVAQNELDKFYVSFVQRNELLGNKSKSLDVAGYKIHIHPPTEEITQPHINIYPKK